MQSRQSSIGGERVYICVQQGFRACLVPVAGILQIHLCADGCGCGRLKPASSSTCGLKACVCECKGLVVADRGCKLPCACAGLFLSIFRLKRHGVVTVNLWLSQSVVVRSSSA
jgi:hypothetical protein